MPYNKNLSGECETDASGPFETIEACVADTTRPVLANSFDRYIAMEALTSDNDIFPELAPSDRVLYLKMRYNITTSPDNSYQIGVAIMLQDYLRLYYVWPEVGDYLRTRLDELDLLLLELLRRQAPRMTKPDRMLFRLDLFRLVMNRTISDNRALTLTVNDIATIACALLVEQGYSVTDEQATDVSVDAADVWIALADYYNLPRV